MTTRFSVTDIAVAVRCQRQMMLAREGLRILHGDGGIGQAAHAILARFVERGPTHPLLQAALDDELPSSAALVLGAFEALYRELFDCAPSLAPSVSSAELVRLARIVFDLSSLAGELLVRARRSGLGGLEAFSRCFEASERRVELEFDDGSIIVSGILDLLLRDIERNTSWVVDLKTGLADAAAEEQVRLYALALAREGVEAQPALAHLSGGTLQLLPVAPVDPVALEERLRALKSVADGSATPAPAVDAETCKSCPVQKQCWSKWGRTLSETATESTAAGEVAEEALKLEKSLRAHRVHLERVDPALAVVGPNVVRFRLSLRQGEGIGKIERSGRDIQRTMGWSMPPLISNEGTFVALDAPRRDREIVPWRMVPGGELAGLEVPIGLTLQRGLLKIDIASAPHMLVAGTTNSGKTVFLKGLILSLLQRLSREQCEVAIIDPKMLDFPPFAALPLFGPVVTDPQDAVALLQSLVDEELPRRTRRLAAAGVTQRSELPMGSEPMPALVVVIDEFADLLAMFPERPARKEFLGAVQRLLQKSRAVGIHLIIATQRPSIDAVPGQLKANLPVRIAFKLPSSTDSMTVLDEGGAENLLGRGDLLFKRDGALTRAQAFNVDAADVQQAIRDTREARLS